jgi:acyl-CoA reductase-like NAD-dependent aldehyde dehydrogenase
MFNPAVPSHFLTPDYRASGGTPLPVIDPATLGQVGHYADTTAAELSGVLAAVNAAQAGWKALDAKTRAQHLHLSLIHI